MLADDPLTQLAFSVYENKGVFALLLGSGLSRAAAIPTGWEITLDLIRRVAMAQGIENQPDWAAWYREKTGQEPNYSVLLGELAASPSERRSILHSYIEPNDEDREAGRKVPTAAHKAIAALARSGYIRVIITTNFDRLTENALRECGVEPTVVASEDALKGAEPITHSTCYILKLHGDYKDARILNTEDELSGYPEPYNDLLDRILDEYGLIVCGWSGEWDHALRKAILRAASRRYSVYWAMRGSLGVGAQDLVNHRRARVVTITDADSFFQLLQQRVETLEQSRRQNPESIELSVNSAKRFLSKPEYRIQLDELFTQETERVIARIGSQDFAVPVQLDPSVFRAHVRQYEATTEALACMAGVLGRWGQDSELPLITDVICQLYAYAESRPIGPVPFPSIRSYPAVLVFTAYGLGLTRAERWSTLHALFSTTIPGEYHTPVRVVEGLFLQSWKGAERDAWNQIEGLERLRAPLGDHLLKLYSQWRKAFARLAPDFELMFERFELLGSLAHLEDYDKETIRKALARHARDAYVPIPFVRIVWNRSNAEKLLAEIESTQMRESLIRAGFAKNDPEFLDLCITNIKRIVGDRFYGR